MKKITHFMYVPFTGLGIHGGYRGDKWLLSRVKIFKEYVIPSLMAQSNQNFIIWVSWRPEEETNPIVTDLFESMSSLRGLQVIFTFYGLCFWDDKYPDEIAGPRLMTALEKTLPELAESVGSSEEVLMTIQPSDDMYFSNFVKDVQDVQWIDTQVLGFDMGYIINYSTQEIAEYNPTTTPPFYTIKFPADIFLNPFRHIKYTGPYKSHEYVKYYLRRVGVAERGFIVGTHGENISTTYNHPYKGRVLSLQEREDVMIKAGIWTSKPIVLAPGGRLYARQMLNRLPFQNIIRDLYYKLPKRCQIF